MGTLLFCALAHRTWLSYRRNRPAVTAPAMSSLSVASDGAAETPATPAPTVAGADVVVVETESDLPQQNGLDKKG